jgi:hypothetical protein
MAMTMWMLAMLQQLVDFCLPDSSFVSSGLMV